MDTLEINPKSNDANDSQNRKLEKDESAKSAKEIVMEYFRAAERRDFKLARSYLSDNISYRGPLNSFDSAEPYFNYFQSLKLPPLNIKKAFVDSNDVCLLYELHYGQPPMTIFACGWFQVNNEEKISSIRVVFDPRPFVQPGR